MAETMPRCARRESPVPGVAGEFVSGEALPGHLARAIIGSGPSNADDIGNEGLEEPTPRWVGFLLLVFAAKRAQFFAQLYAEPDRIVLQDHPGVALHHLRTDVE